MINMLKKMLISENCDPETEELVRELHNSSEGMDSYPAEIEYKCPLGMAFQHPKANDTTHSTQTAMCGWDGLWHLSPVNSLHMGSLRKPTIL